MLEHPYLASYHDPEDEPSATPFDNKYDDVDFTIPQWQSASFLKSYALTGTPCSLVSRI